MMTAKEKEAWWRWVYDMITTGGRHCGLKDYEILEEYADGDGALLLLTAEEEDEGGSVKICISVEESDA
jgi:hypothetical protein